MSLQTAGSTTFTIQENRLTARDGSNLPALCVRCGKPSQLAPEARTYRGFPPEARWIYLFKLGARQLVIRLFGNRAKVDVFVCDEHKKRMRVMRWLGLLMLLLTPVVFVAMIAMSESQLINISVTVAWLFAATYARNWGSTLLTPVAVTKSGEGIFHVPSQEFLAAVRQAPRP